MKYQTLVGIVSVGLLTVSCALFSGAEEQELETTTAAQQITTFVDTVVPDGPWKPIAVTLASIFSAKLFAKRYRQNVGVGLSNMAQGNLKEGMRMLASAGGLKHTTEDPEQLVRVARKLSDKTEAPVA